MTQSSTLPSAIRTSSPSRASIAHRTLALCLLVLRRTVAAAQKPPPQQANDPDYTAKIKESLTDPRFSTDLVDHLPASKTVPTPLKFLGTVPGQPGELYYNA